MEKQRIILFFILFFYLFSASAQTGNPDTQNNDSILSDKGNLNLLAERIYLAFKSYKTGVYKFDEDQKLDSINNIYLDSLQRKGWHVNVLRKSEKKILPVVIRKGELVNGINDYNKIPVDSVYSIEVMENGVGITALYGLSSNGVVVRLKE